MPSSESGLSRSRSSRLHDDVVLIHLRVRLRDQPLAVHVVEGVVDHLRRDPEARRRIAIDLDADLKPGVLLIAVDVLQLRELLHRVDDAWRPREELVEVRVLHRVLVLGAALAPADAHVLTRLEVSVDPLDLRELAAKACQHLVRAQLAGRERPEHQKAGARVARALPARPDERDVMFDVRVFAEDLVHPCLQVEHFRVRGVLRSLGRRHQEAGVLLREEPLGDVGEERDVDGDRQGGDEEHRHAMPQRPVEAALVEGEHRVEHALGRAIEAAMLHVLLRA